MRHIMSFMCYFRYYIYFFKRFNKTFAISQKNAKEIFISDVNGVVLSLSFLLKLH